jgi:hypothetical protein
MAKNIAEQIVEMLENANVKRIYAVTGDSLNHLNIAVKKSSIQWIHVRHEEVELMPPPQKQNLMVLRYVREAVDRARSFNQRSL